MPNHPYRKISMNRKPRGSQRNRPGPTALAVKAQFDKAARGLQRLFRRHLERRRNYSRQFAQKYTRMALRKMGKKSTKVSAVAKRFQARAYKSAWRAHRNRYKKRKGR